MSQGNEAKKEEFRKYLEKTGVVDQLTRVLVGLYEEPDKPSSAVDYLKKYLGSSADTDVDRLKQDYERVREENTKLKKQIEEVRKEVTMDATQIEKRKADD